jgi:hypothetical protein
MDEGNIWTLLRATRAERSLYIVSMLLIPTAFANKITPDIFVLSLCCILLYSVSGIHNSKRDKDHPIPNYYKKVIVFLVFSSVLLSLYNIIIFLTVIISILLGIFYNTASRKILFGDATVLGFTHAAIPIISSSLLVGLSIATAIKLAVVFYAFIWILGNIRNQKDSKEDKKREYKTYATIIKNPRILTQIFIGLSFFIVSLSLIIFKLNPRSLIIFALISLIYIAINILTSLKKDVLAMQILRLVILLFSFMLVIGTTSNRIIVYFEIVLIILFLWITGLISLFFRKFSKHIKEKHC